MSSNQDWYICMQAKGGKRPELTELCCVNISRLVCDNSRPQLERLHRSAGRYVPNKKSTLFKNSVTNTVHKMEFPDCYSVVTTIDTKLYVLLKSRIEEYDYRGRRLIPRAVFQVFDPFYNAWKTLPHPPFSGTHHDCPYAHFEWGHMLGIYDRLCHYDELSKGLSYVFDTIEEKWMPAVGLPRLVCAVEFSGFLIGVECYGNRISIVAYKLDDENGLPDSNSRHKLDNELWELFYPPLEPCHGPFLHRFGDDHVIFLSTVYRNRSTLLIVAVFRVSISTVGCNIPVVSAVFQHKHVYELDNEQTYVSSTFLMQNAPSYGTHISNMTLILHQPLEHFDYGHMQDEDDNINQDLDEAMHGQDDDIAPVLPSKVQNLEKKIREDVEWDDGLKQKFMYMCFVEKQTDCSVSYIIKAMKFSDLISTSSHDSKLHQVASTSGCHLASVQSCAVFGSLILFADSGEQVPSSRDIYIYDVTSNDPNIKRSTKFFKGLKPQPVLAEVEGKLYALAGFPIPKYMNPGHSFEIYDPIEKQWSSLPDPPSYTKFTSSNNYHAIAGTNLLSWGYESPGVFRFDMAADSVDNDWRLINNSSDLFFDEGQRSTIVVDSDGNGGGDFILFTYQNGWHSTDLRVHLISGDFDYVVRLPSLKLPESVSSFLKAQNHSTGRSSFVHLGGRRVCLVVSCPFNGPYSKTLNQLGEVDKMSTVIVVFEFQVTKNRESVAAEFVFHCMLEYDTDTNSDARGNPKTSDIHMVGAFLL